MTRGEKVWSACAMLLCTLLLAGCTEQETQTTPQPAPGPPPPSTLEAEWSIPGLNSNPSTAGQHHWATYQSTLTGMGRGTTSTRGPFLLVDARTGKARSRSPEPARFPCLTSTRISDSGVFPVLWAAYDGTPDRVQLEPCSRITVLDVSTGEVLWRDADIDFSGLSAGHVITANDDAVAAVDPAGKIACFASRDGEALPDDAAACLALRDRVTHADLPDLMDLDGDPAPLAFGDDTDASANTEIGRTDDVLLVRAYSDDDNKFFVRAHDLGSGETLWEDTDLTPDPYPNDAWYRGETYFVAPSGIVRVSYEHPEDEVGQRYGTGMTATPMVLTAVDPRTGEDIKPIARINGAWFNHQFGDMTVALTHQERAFKSQISGFRLPTW